MSKHSIFQRAIKFAPVPTTVDLLICSGRCKEICAGDPDCSSIVCSPIADAYRVTAIQGKDTAGVLDFSNGRRSYCKLQGIQIQNSMKIFIYIYIFNIRSQIVKTCLSKTVHYWLLGMSHWTKSLTNQLITVNIMHDSQYLQIWNRLLDL